MAVSSVLLRQASCRRFLSSSSVKKTFLEMFSPSRAVSPKDVPPDIVRPTYVTRGKDKVPHMPEVKSQEEIEAMRPACQLAASILQEVEGNIRVGMTTEAIDDLVHALCLQAKAYPSPLLYKGFPKSVCTSVNQVACHGIPGSLVLKDGDIVNVDVTVFYQGYHGDTSATFLVGEVEERSKDLVMAAQACRDIGIQVCRDGAPFSDIGEAIYELATDFGFEVIHLFCGHGIGTYFHGPPNIVHVPSDSAPKGTMAAGMTFTVEPVLCDGSPDIQILRDGWTVVTTDKSRSAQFEHTVLVTHEGCEILTQCDQDR